MLVGAVATENLDHSRGILPAIAGRDGALQPAHQQIGKLTVDTDKLLVRLERMGGISIPNDGDKTMPLALRSREARIRVLINVGAGSDSNIPRPCPKRPKLGGFSGHRQGRDGVPAEEPDASGG